MDARLRLTSQRNRQAHQQWWRWSLCVCLLLCGGLTGCANLGKSDGAYAAAKPSLFGGKKNKVILDPELGFEDYDIAVASYEAQDYAQAEKQLKSIIKKFEDYPVEEDARFLLAESYFSQQNYPRARDHYEGLCKKYPSTRHLEQSTRRLYAIGIAWLTGDEKTAPGELVQVSAEEIEQPGSSERPAAAHPYSLVPNVTDRKRPVFDTTGFALKCLKSVWLYDPTGPLADDALMATAVHYVRKGNLREADYYFDMLRQEYPKSEFCQKAFVLGSKVKLANYQGPRYDSKHLSAADELLRTSLAIYPNLEERDQLQSDLKRVQEQAAERDYSHGIYYERRGKPQAAVIYYETVVNEHPDTSWAEKARERLAELGPQDWSVKPRVPEAPAAIASVSVDGNVRKSFIPKPKLWPFTSTNKAPETVTPIDDEPTFIQQLVPDDEELGSESTGSARVD